MTSWLVTGATGQVGSHVVAELAKSSENVVVAIHSGREEVNAPLLASTLHFACDVHYEAVDLAGDASVWAPQVEAVMQRFKTTVVVHCAAISNLKVAFENPQMARAVNVTATQALARLAVELKCSSFLHCSTDMVFDGSAGLGGCGSFYEEDAPTCPVAVYGLTKVEAEDAIRSTAVGSTKFIIARLPLMFGLVHTPNGVKGTGTFAAQLRQLIQPEQRCCGFTDEYRTPISFRTAARAIIELTMGAGQSKIPIELGNPVIIHLAGKERISRFDMLVKMRTVLSQMLLGNTVTISSPNTETTARNFLKALGIQEGPPSPQGVSNADVQSPLTPAEQLIIEGGKVRSATIEETSRHSFPSSEPRPEDLSMSSKRLDVCLAAMSLQGNPLFHLSLEEQMTESLELWLQLL